MRREDQRREENEKTKEILRREMLRKGNGIKEKQSKEEMRGG